MEKSVDTCPSSQIIQLQPITFDIIIIAPVRLAHGYYNKATANGSENSHNTILNRSLAP